MPDMFDRTTVGKPYLRIDKISIDYPAEMTAVVRFAEQTFVPCVDGSHLAVGELNYKEFMVMPADMGTKFELLDVATGAKMGAQVSYGQLLVSILSAIRAHQNVA